MISNEKKLLLMSDTNTPKSRKTKRNMFNQTDFKKIKIDLTKNQDKLVKIINQNTLTLVTGPSGTSKTFTSCFSALKLLSQKKIQKIVITKPIIESSKSLGYLPGSVDLKIEPYMKSYISTFIKLIGKEKTDELLRNDIISIQTLNFMRGDTFDDSMLILDESQNLPVKDLMLWITRLGKNSKAVCMGDVSQYDVKKSESGFSTFKDIMTDIDGFSFFEFERSDIVRNKFLIDVTDSYEKWKYGKES